VVRKPIVKAAIIVLDAFLINAAFALAYELRYQFEWFYPLDERFYTPFRPYVPFAILLTTLCLASYSIDGLYQGRRRRWFDEMYSLVGGTMTSIVIVMAITFLAQPLFYSRVMLVYVAVLIVVLLGAARLGERGLEAYLRRRGVGVVHVLVVGAGRVGRAVMRTLLGDPSLGYQVVGYVDDDPDKGDGQIGRFPGLGGLDNLSDLIVEHKVDEVIVTLPWAYHRKIMKVVDRCARERVRVRIVPDLFQQRLNQVDVDSLGGIPLIGVGEPKLTRGVMLIKRMIDLALSAALLVIGCVPLLLVALAIRLDSPGPVVFSQRRVGKDSRPFTVYKFRSMVDGAEAMHAAMEHYSNRDGPTIKVHDDPRCTRVGRLLRRFSVDELPQLLNVLRGEMSLVGPRPGLPEEVARYEGWHRQRLAVWPGMTGLWQVSGRADVSFDEMCQLDIYYIENWSLGLDLRIILRTIPTVIFGNGAY
jgi:exopolysaccharide biosynthesis polyprenyl glycosylphosphotransferase